jgi:radical SAM superfamily enzyme YgiQ (UPF0313 family)
MKPKILFINVSIDRDKYGPFKYFFKPFHPISLIYVASAIKSTGGYDVRVIDMEQENLKVEAVVEEIRKEKPDFLAIGILTPSAIKAERICRETRRVSPGTKIIAGNLHASFAGESWIREGLIDFVVYGEGEEVSIKLINTLINNGDVSNIPSIAYFENGNVRINPRGNPPLDLDSLPFPDWSLINFPKYKINFFTTLQGRGAPVFFTRGCPYSCTFCAIDKLSRRLRHRSPENAIEEVQKLIKDYNINFLWVMDPTFGINKTHTISLLEEFIRNGIHKRLKWVCGMRTDNLDTEVLRLMKEAGCQRIFLGFESGVDRLLSNVKKGTDINKGREAVKKVKEYGMEVTGIFMIGLPGETREDTEKTIKYACSLDIDFVKFAITIPFPGTAIFEDLYNSGKLKRVDWENYLPFTFYPDILVNINNIQSSRELIFKLITSHFRFYANPKRIFNLLKSLR